MITDLHISNYALIDSIDLTFGPGLNIITGETGAGKSIILGALGLLLGARADSRVIRRPDEKSVVEATFTIADADPRLHEALAEAGVEPEKGTNTLTLRRELASNGRNRVFVNDSLITLAQLQKIAALLVDIHSQHQNALLADQAYQLRLLDSLAGNHTILERYSAAYTAYRHALRRYRQERAQLDQAREEEEYLRFQHYQLVEAVIQPDEVAALEAEQRRLANAAAIGDALAAIRRLFASEESGAVAQLEEASGYASRLAQLAQGEETSELEQRLESLRIELDDLTSAYETMAENMPDDPARLDDVENRLATIYTLMRRYKVDHENDLIALREQMADRLRALDLGDETLRALEVEAKRAKKAALAVAAELTDRRAAEAQRLGDALADQARPLGMDNLCVEIALNKTPLGPTGSDAVEFLFAFNKNQTPTTVASSASGGEISRLMLAVKSLAATTLQMPTIVFDEVDTGVSGAIAARMGGLMKEISAHIQVIAITHLPQVAALGNRHFRVFKHDTETSTVTSVGELSADERVEEIAKMLSGSAVDAAATANARALLSASQTH